MKQLIVLMAVLPIMIIFIMQMGLDQKNAQTLTAIQSCTYAAKEQAKQEGCFTEAICSDLRRNISKRTNIKEENIEIEADRNLKYRYSDDKLIHYKVSVKVGNIMAANRVFGLSDKENSYKFSVESYTASERVDL